MPQACAPSHHAERRTLLTLRQSVSPQGIYAKCGPSLPDTHKHTPTLPVISDAQRPLTSIHRSWVKPIRLRTSVPQYFCISGSFFLTSSSSLFNNQLHSIFPNFSRLGLTKPGRYEIPGFQFMLGCFCFTEDKKKMSITTDQNVVREASSLIGFWHDRSYMAVGKLLIPVLQFP